jgi:LysM repeat protein
MKPWKRVLYYLGINVLVSACTVLVVLNIWSRTRPQSTVEGEPVGLILTSPTPSEAPGALDATQMISGTVNLSVTTPTATLAQNVREHEVVAGDTLGIIAERYDVTIEALIEANGLSDPNSLDVGQIIYIPVDPSTLPTATQGPTRTPSATHTPSGPPQEAGVKITSVIAAGDLASEHVFLTRTGDGELSLAGWQLRDEDGNVYVFPQLELFEDGAVNVWTTSGSPTVVDLYWGLQTPVWESGEKVTLRDDQGDVRATYTIP